MALLDPPVRVPDRLMDNLKKGLDGEGSVQVSLDGADKIGNAKVFEKTLFSMCSPDLLGYMNEKVTGTSRPVKFPLDEST